MLNKLMIIRAIAGGLLIYVIYSIGLTATPLAATPTLAAVTAAADTFNFGKQRELEHREEDRYLQVILEGTLVIDEETGALQHVAPGGRVFVKKCLEGRCRSVEAAPGAGDTPEYIYHVEDNRRPFDNEVLRWLASILDETLERFAQMEPPPPPSSAPSAPSLSPR